MMEKETDKLKKSEPTCARVMVYRDKNDKREYLIIEGVTGKFALIGGAKDLGDLSLEETIRRELLEEVGLRLGKEKIVNTGIIRKFTYTDHNQRIGEKAIDLNYVIKIDPSAKLQKTKEIKNYYWMTYEEALEKISYDDLKKIFEKLQEYL